MKRVPLGELITAAKLRRAGTETFPVLSMTMHEGLVNQSQKFKKRIASDDVSVYKVIARGQLVVGFPIDEGVLDFQRHYDAAIVSPAYGVWDVDSSLVERDYLGRFLRSPQALAYYKAKLRGSTARRRSLPSEVFLALDVPLLALDEQRRIAAILDRADGLRNKSLGVLQHHRDLPPAIFRDTFGRWNGPCATIAEVAQPDKGAIRTGPFGSQLLHSEFVDRGIAVLGLDNVVGNEFTWGERRYITVEKYDALRRYTVRPGDVLMSIMGTCGRCVVVPSDIGTAINTKHICAITVDARKALPDFVRAAFLWHPMSRQFLARMTKGSVMDGLNMGIIKATPIPLPDLGAQQAFVDRMKAIDECTCMTAELQTQSDELFASIQARAFRGEL